MKTLYFGLSPNVLSTPTTYIPQPTADALSLPSHIHHPLPTSKYPLAEPASPEPSGEVLAGAKTSTENQSRRDDGAKCKKLQKINGRPKKSEVTAALIRQMQAEGRSLSQIAKELGVSIRTVKYRLSATRNWWKEF